MPTETSRQGGIYRGLVASGLFLVAVGFAWPLMVGDATVLSQAAAEEYVDAAVALHGSVEGDRSVDGDGEAHGGAGHPHDHSHDGHAAAEQRMDAAIRSVERARFLRNGVGRVLWGTGAALVIVGGLGLRGRQAADSSGS